MIPPSPWTVRPIVTYSTPAPAGLTLLGDNPDSVFRNLFSHFPDVASISIGKLKPLDINYYARFSMSGALLPGVYLDLRLVSQT